MVVAIRKSTKMLIFFISCIMASTFFFLYRNGVFDTVADAIDEHIETIEFEHQTLYPYKKQHSGQICSKVDVVYTWVNGSSPEQREIMKKFNVNWEGGFRDYGVLKYSARSVAKFMPWVRNIILVTNGQIPDWVDPKSPRFRLVTHKEIFPDENGILPTFNSNAIEANLYKIPDLAPCFLYMNDDMFLGAPVTKETFFDRYGNLRLHMSRGFFAPMKEKAQGNAWHRCVLNSNRLLNAYYYPDKDPDEVRHPYAAHTCYFMRKDIVDTIAKRWPEEVLETSRNKFRTGEDLQLPFLQANVALEEFGASSVKMKDMYGTWTEDKEHNDKVWKKMWKKKNICICLNDRLDNSQSSRKEIARLNELFESKFPKPSFIERKGA